MSNPAARLRAVREARGDSLRAISERTGIDIGHISRIERGLATPSLETLRKLGEALDLRDLVRQLDLFVGV